MSSKELRQLRADIEANAKNITAVFGEMKRSVRPVIREETRKAFARGSTYPYSEDLADEAIAENIFQTTQGSGMRGINRPPQRAPSGGTKAESRSRGHQSVSDYQESDEDLANDIFAASGGNPGFEHSPTSMGEDAASGDDEDARLAKEIFDAAGGNR